MNLLVIEDHPIVVSGCRALFVDVGGVDMVQAATIEEGRKLYAANKPDVVVIDINLPDGSGLDLAREILSLDTNAKIVIFTMSDAPVLAIQALEIGARGYVSKNGDPTNLRDAVYAVARGERWLPHELMQEIALMRTGATGRTPVLSDRQVQILRSLARGKNMSEIAHEIDVCYKTVASNCAEMRSKLNARTSSEMVRIAVQLRIV
ncbi:MAG: response regulator [Hyphomicrobium sp.]